MEELSTIQTAALFRGFKPTLEYLELMAAYYLAGEEETADAVATLEALRLDYPAAAAEFDSWSELHEEGPELSAYYSCDVVRRRWPEIEIELPLAALGGLTPGLYLAAFVTAARTVSSASVGE